MNGQSSISANADFSSIDLALLCKALAKAMKDVAQKGSLIVANGSKLTIDLGAALRALYKTDEFTALKDSCVRVPSTGGVVRVGGRVPVGTDAAAGHAIREVARIAQDAVSAALTHMDAEKLLFPCVDAMTSTLAASASINLPQDPDKAVIVSLDFIPAKSQQTIRRSAATLLSAIELVKNDDYEERIANGVCAFARMAADLDEAEIDHIRENVRAQCRENDSQLRAFIDFLEDVALARARLMVGFRLMTAVAESSGSDALKRYVDNVRQCYRLFAEPTEDTERSVVIDATQLGGIGASISLNEAMRAASFYACLPVWVENKTQMHEMRSPSHIAREVSYRFRVNGNTPENKLNAFEARLAAAERLLNAAREQREEVSGYALASTLAKLAFLYLVIPGDDEVGSFLERAKRIAEAVKRDPAAAMGRLIHALRRRNNVVSRLSRDLITTLRKGNVITSDNRSSERIYVSVNKGVINLSALLSMTSSKSEILCKHESGNDPIAWLKHVVVSEHPDPGALALVEVETSLTEHTLVDMNENIEIDTARDKNVPVLPVRIRPDDQDCDSLDFGRGVDLLYHSKYLRLNKPDAWHLRTAACAAFSLLVYVVLLQILCALKERGYEFCVRILRIQVGGADEEPASGDNAVFAIGRAIEHALARTAPVMMQGYHLSGEKKTAKYRLRNSILALRCGLPLTIPKGEKIAIVTYVTRQLSESPTAKGHDYLFLLRSWVTSQENGANWLRPHDARSYIMNDADAFHEPQLLLDEIGRLHEKGLRHIVLISHHFGNRHIGRAADRHAPHSSSMFLENVHQRFPQVFVYPLRKDVFPATRLRMRSHLESAFEVRGFTSFIDAHASDVLRGQIPVYTFATLAVVGDGETRPQSGFCTYYFDIEQRLRDFVWQETLRQNILGIGEGAPVRKAILDALRALHFIESEHPSTQNLLLPTLDPFSWVAPLSAAEAGEIVVYASRRGRKKTQVVLSIHALLAYVSAAIHADGN